MFPPRRIFFTKDVAKIMKIKEWIVVEGRDDTAAIRRAVDADTIETNGSAISMDTIAMIKHAQAGRGVIVFTDPDFPGEKIRHTIAQHVPGCKHAFIPKELALPKKGKGLGVEHAAPETIREALKDALLMESEAPEVITREDLIDAGLISGEGARRRRERLGKLLKIGYANGKQLHKRLMLFQITREQFAAAMMELIQEEQDA